MDPATVREGYLLPPRATVLALVGVLLAVLLAALNQTVIATVMPRIVSDLGGGDRYSWAFSGYMLALAVTTPLCGRVSDVHGRRPLLLGGLAVFLFGALVSVLAQSMDQFILGRVVQGLAAGAIIPVAFATIADLVPPSDRGRWQGYSGVVFGVASVAGPFSGGWVADRADWRWVLVLSLPLGLAALGIIGAHARIPPHPRPATGFDRVGAVLLAGALTTGLLALLNGSEATWGSARFLALLIASAALFALLALWERGQQDPVVPIALLRTRTGSTTIAGGFTTGVMLFGAIVYVPLFVQRVLGDSATDSGLTLAPLLVAMMTASAVSGRLISRTGRYRWALLSGPALICAGFALLSSLDAGSGRPDVAVATALVGLGLGLLSQNLLLVLQNRVPSRDVGTATGAFQLSRSLGNAIGVAVMGAILVAGLPAHTATDSFAGIEPTVLADALRPLFLLGIPLAVITLAVTALIPEVPLRRTARDDALDRLTEARV
jgi:EmrB/QacA subfamily drug resistance transporter